MSTFNDWAGEDKPANGSDIKGREGHQSKKEPGKECFPEKRVSPAGPGVPYRSRKMRHERCIGVLMISVLVD